jgi:hypothetical protein
MASWWFNRRRDHHGVACEDHAPSGSRQDLLAMDRPRHVARGCAMRWALLLARLTASTRLTDCGITPAEFGITGPGPQVPPEAAAPNDTPMSPPGLPDPSTGSGADQRFYHYR